MLGEQRVKLTVTILGSLVFILLVTVVSLGLNLHECKELKEGYKKEATKTHVYRWDNRNTLYEESKGSLVTDEPEYTVAIDFLWTKHKDKFKNRRVKSVYMSIPTHDQVSAVGQAIINLDTKKLDKCKPTIFRGKEKDNAYCITVEIVYQLENEDQLTPGMLASWLNATVR